VVTTLPLPSGPRRCDYDYLKLVADHTDPAGQWASCWRLEGDQGVVRSADLEGATAG
jgi:hypothetical protein